jgi:hypothetical protein
MGAPSIREIRGETVTIALRGRPFRRKVRVSLA